MDLPVVLSLLPITNPNGYGRTRQVRLFSKVRKEVKVFAETQIARKSRGSPTFRASTIINRIGLHSIKLDSMTKATPGLIQIDSRESFWIEMTSGERPGICQANHPIQIRILPECQHLRCSAIHQHDDFPSMNVAEIAQLTLEICIWPAGRFRWASVSATICKARLASTFALEGTA
jgi:hypothetical protein